ncbi:MAG: phage major capsid protein [Ignavibacterium sp.]|nr:phage major capsid protein [Ignavibacterium sp.]
MEENKLEFTKDELVSVLTEATLETFKKANKVETPAIRDEEKNPAYVFSKMLTAIRQNDKSTLKALDPNIEGSNTAGGYLVPRITQAKIWEVVGTYGQARKLFSELPVTQTGKMAVPKYGSGVTAYWVGENQPITASKASFDVVNIDTKKLAAIVAVSNELLEDALVDVGEFLIKKIGEAFGKAEDNAFFNGTSPFTGLFQVNTGLFGNQVSVSNPDDISYEKLLDMVYGIDQSYLDGAKWLMHRTTLSQIRKIKDTTGNPIFFPANDGTIGTLLGFPVVLVESAPNVTSPGVIAILGNPSNTYYGVKKELSVQLLTEATIDGTNLAERDLSAIRVIERVAFDKGLTETYSCLYIA